MKHYFYAACLAIVLAFACSLQGNAQSQSPTQGTTSTDPTNTGSTESRGNYLGLLGLLGLYGLHKNRVANRQRTGRGVIEPAL
jgi:hypothetical protein